MATLHQAAQFESYAFANMGTWLANRELLAGLSLADLCPSTNVGLPGGRAGLREDAAAELLGKEGPRSTLRLPVQDARAPRRPIDDEAGPEAGRP